VKCVCVEKFCNECRGNIVLNKGVYVCENCGLEVAKHYKHYVDSSYLITIEGSSGCDARQYVGLGSRSDVVGGLGSCIGRGKGGYETDYNKVPISKETATRMRHLDRIYNFRARIREKESEYRVLKSLNRTVALLQVSQETKKRAAYIYRKGVKILDKNEITTHPVCMTGALFISVREYDEPITLQEIARTFEELGHRVPVKSVLKVVENLKRLPGVKLKTRRSEAYIPRLVSKIVRHPEVVERLKKRRLSASGYQEQLKHHALALLERISREERGGRHPFVFAVSSVYAADLLLEEILGRKHLLTQKMLARITEVAQYSIRDHNTTLFKKCISELSSTEAPLA